MQSFPEARTRSHTVAMPFGKGCVDQSECCSLVTTAPSLLSPCGSYSTEVFSQQEFKDYDSYFLSGRSMPWWLLGTSMVATTFATDTPNLVTGIVRRDGVFGNWIWWSFLLTGTTTVFLYAKLWRRSDVLTDIEFYELRYSGKPAAFLREGEPEVLISVSCPERFEPVLARFLAQWDAAPEGAANTR